jgi:hypothetical protein
MTNDQVALLQAAADCCRAAGLLDSEAFLNDIIANEQAGQELDAYRALRANRAPRRSSY